MQPSLATRQTDNLTHRAIDRALSSPLQFNKNELNHLRDFDILCTHLLLKPDVSACNSLGMLTAIDWYSQVDCMGCNGVGSVKGEPGQGMQGCDMCDTSGLNGTSDLVMRTRADARAVLLIFDQKKFINISNVVELDMSQAVVFDPNEHTF